jgi:hypothetical protein
VEIDIGQHQTVCECVLQGVQLLTSRSVEPSVLEQVSDKTGFGEITVDFGSL